MCYHTALQRVDEYHVTALTYILKVIMSYLNSWLPAKLTITDGIITISNISKRLMEKDIYRLFKSSRVFNYMFHQSSGSSIVFPEFFALELYHILDMLISERYLGTSVKKIDQLQKLLMEETWLKNTQVKHPDIVNIKRLLLFKYKPLAHQTDFFTTYNNTVPKYGLNGMLLASAPGTGKTYASLALAECLMSDVIIVVCPNPAVNIVWKDSVVGSESLYHRDPTCWTYNSGEPYRHERVVIFHYEALDKALRMINYFKKKKVTIILDESHNLNEFNTARSKQFIELCKELDCQNVILATGTPIKALAVETVTLLAAIDPLFTKEVQVAFSKMHAGEVSKRTEILLRRLHVISFRVSKDVTRLEKPLVEDIEVTLPDGDLYTLKAISAAMREYARVRLLEIEKMLPEALVFFKRMVDQAEQQLSQPRLFSEQSIRETKEGFATYRQEIKTIRDAHAGKNLMAVSQEIFNSNRFEKSVIVPTITDKSDRDLFLDIKSIVKYPRLKVRGECLGRVMGKKRIDAYVAMVKAIPFEDIMESTTKKTVVFTSFVDVVKASEQHLKEQGLLPLVVYGEHTARLSEIVKDFGQEEKYNPLIATYASLSTAVPLVMTDTMIIVNPPYRDYILEQTIARIHRIGTNTQIRVFNMVLKTGAEPNISSRNIDIIEWSRQQSSAILSLKAEDVDPEELSSIATEHFDYTDLKGKMALYQW